MKAKALFSLFFCVVALLSPVVRAGVYDVPNGVKVGAFFYSWYSADGLNGSGSNGCSWAYPDVMDKPVVGFYNSSDRSVIDQQLAWVSDLKIDFLIMSWFGAGSLTDNNTKIFFDEAVQNVSSVKLCIMVEAYLGTVPEYDYTAIQDYVWDTFVAPYPNEYLMFPDHAGNLKPLLVWWNTDNFTDPSLLTPFLQDRFVPKIVGMKTYVDWVYHDAIVDWRPFYYPIPRERCYPLSPRYDDTNVYGRVSGANGIHSLDVTYADGFYVDAWADCLRSANAGGVSVVTICSWNEYEERTMIEPHYDRTAFTSDPYYVYNVTKEYVLKLKGLYDAGGGLPWYERPFSLFLFIMGVLLSATIAFKRTR